MSVLKVPGQGFLPRGQQRIGQEIHDLAAEDLREQEVTLHADVLRAALEEAVFVRHSTRSHTRR